MSWHQIPTDLSLHGPRRGQYVTDQGTPGEGHAAIVHGCLDSTAGRRCEVEDKVLGSKVVEVVGDQAGVLFVIHHVLAKLGVGDNHVRRAERVAKLSRNGGRRIRDSDRRGVHGISSLGCRHENFTFDQQDGIPSWAVLPSCWSNAAYLLVHRSAQAVPRFTLGVY